MKYIELFAGIGGFRYGLENVSTAERVQQRVDSEDMSCNGKSSMAIQQFTCVWANEIDKYAATIYRKNYGGKELYEGDIRLVSTNDIPEHDLLVGGFPCQAFSIAGKRAGFDDTRGTLFFEIARILRDKKPRCVLLENVKGLLSHDSGKTFQTILGVLADIGYRIEWQVLNSKNFGVPQNRERVFIVGHLGNRSRGQVFPIGETNGAINTGFNQGDTEVASTLRSRYGNGSHIMPLNNPTHSNDRVYAEKGLSPALNTMQGGNRQPKIAIHVLTPDRPEKRQNGRRMKDDGEPSFTLTSQDKHGVFDGARIRRLTPIECERLQGFEDNWTAGISDSQRYKCLGNAVTTNVITAIGQQIF